MNTKNYLGYTLLLLLSVCMSCSNGSQQQFKESYLKSCNSAKQLDSLFTNLTNSNKFSGEVLLADSSQILLKKCYGFSDCIERTSLTPGKRFQIASISKQFTAMGIMMLKEQGKMNYDDSVKMYISEFPYNGITIRNLLTHTSGLPDFYDGITTAINHSKINDNTDLLKVLIESHPAAKAKPYEKWEYNNIAYEMLALIIERVSGLTYNDFLTKNIFIPLGMSNTRSAISYIDSSGIDNAVTGFAWQSDKNCFVKPHLLKGREDTYYLSGMRGDGSIYSTVDDLYKWSKALSEYKLISKSAFEEAITPVKMANGEPYKTPWNSYYGFGWGIATDSIMGKYISHGGGQTGYRSCIYKLLEKDITLIVLCNIENDEFWSYNFDAAKIAWKGCLANDK